jgi:hypothetical protein
MFTTGETMKTFRRLPLVLILASTFSARLVAKCPTGKVTVRAKVDNLPSTATEVEATVVVESKNGRVSRTVSISDGQFTAEVPFSTQSSSFFGTDRCHTVPRSVEVSIGSAAKSYVHQRLNFNDYFEKTKLYEYRLKHELSLNALALSSKSIRAENPAPAHRLYQSTNNLPAANWSLGQSLIRRV